MPRRQQNRSPRRRFWTVLQLSGIGLLMAAAVTLGLGAGAGATGPSSGSTVPNAIQTVGSVAANSPFDSGQIVNVDIPANSAFAQNAGVNLVECAAPNGVVPTLTTACDGLTLQNGALVAADGSFTFNGYTVYALPDSTSLGEGTSGPVCGDTLATECILYIGENQNDFTAPHLWSAPFFIQPDKTDSGTSNPGDGTGPAVAQTVSAGVSTVVASPTTAVADGVDLSTVTVTLLDSAAVPIAGKAVTLTSSSSTAKVTGPSPALTDSNGQTTFTVTDTVAEPVTLTATDTTDTITVTQKPILTFQAPKVDASHSTVSANPTTVTPPAISTTITVTLRDQGANAQPMPGQTVTLAGTGSAVITPAQNPNITNASGVVTFSATDSAAEKVTFTATAGSTVIANTASVTFGTLNVSASQSTVTASSPAPLGSSGTTVVVTLLTSTNSPVQGKTVTLSSTGSAVVGAPSPATTGSNGQVSFPLTDTVPETVTLTATDTTDSNLVLTSTPTVTFATASPSASASTVTASATTSPADGETQTLISVTVNDQFGDPLSGKTVTLDGAPSGNVQIHPIAVGSSTPGITDSSGLVQFEADDSAAEVITFTATDTTDNLVLTKTVSITYTPGAADPNALGTTVTASPTNPPADGHTSSTITVTLTDYFSNPIAGKTIGLKALNGGSTIATVSAVTSQAGQATFTVTDPTAEVVTYQATDNTDGNAVLAAEAVVKFGNPPSPPPVAAYCSVVADPTSVPADGTHTATISVLLYDGNGDPVAGKAVTLAGSGGASTVTATNGTTNNSGIATFTVSDATVEKVTYTADDTTDSVDLTGIPVTVSFATAAATTTTTTTTTTSSSTTTTTTSGTTTTTGAAVGLSGSTAATTSTGNSGGATSSLAATGSPALLPWLIGFGLIFLAAGAVGRRRFNGEHNEG
jgi:hypothetical protein